MFAALQKQGRFYRSWLWLFLCCYYIHIRRFQADNYIMIAVPPPWASLIPKRTDLKTPARKSYICFFIKIFLIKHLYRSWRCCYTFENISLAFFKFRICFLKFPFSPLFCTINGYETGSYSHVNISCIKGMVENPSNVTYRSWSLSRTIFAMGNKKLLKLSFVKHFWAFLFFEPFASRTLFIIRKIECKCLHTAFVSPPEYISLQPQLEIRSLLRYFYIAYRLEDVLQFC